MAEPVRNYRTVTSSPRGTTSESDVRSSAEPRPAIDQLVAATRTRYQQASPRRTAQPCRAGALLVDTRCSELRWEHGVIPEAVHVPLSVLPWRADPASDHHDPRLAAKRPLIIMCQDGWSSTLAVGVLLDLGLTDVCDVTGGYRAWQEAGLPTVRLPSETDRSSRL